MKRTLHYLFYIFCKFFFRFYCPLHISGKENLPPPPFILCSNHCSHMDTPALMLATGLPFHYFGMIAAKDYFFANAKRKNIATLFMNLIPIHRKCTRGSIAKDFSMCGSFIQQGNHNLIIYPEGTRSLTGDVQPFKRGPAMMATELGVPIVPVHIQGTHYTLGKGRTIPRRGKISVVIGEPLHAKQENTISRKEKFESYHTMTTILENKIKALKEMHYDK